MTTTNAARDEFETALLQDALERDLPVLAICRGHQLFNVAHGGSLLQHIAEREPHRARSGEDGAIDSGWHEVTLADGSLLAGLFGERSLNVNSAMVAKGSQVLAHSRPNRFVVERAGESLPEGDKPFHFGRSPGGLTRLGRRGQRFHSDLLPLPHLVEHEDDCEDDESGQKLEPPAIVDLLHKGQHTPERARDDGKERDRQAEQQEQVVATDQSHGAPDVDNQIAGGTATAYGCAAVLSRCAYDL